MTMSRTPTPWKQLEKFGGAIVGPDGRQVASVTLNAAIEADDRDANAAFIVQACNAHDALVAGLELVVRAAEALGSKTPAQRCANIAEIARAALRAAGGAL